MLLTHLAALIGLLVAATETKADAIAAPFAPNIEYDGGGSELCGRFLDDVRADFFDGAPGVEPTGRHRKAPPVYADALSDELVAQEDSTSFSYSRLTRYWGDIDGDGALEEVDMTTYFGDGASGNRIFAGLTKLDREGVMAVREEWRRRFESGHQGEGARYRARAPSILRHIMEDTYVFVVDYGPSTGPDKKFFVRGPLQIRDAPDGDHLQSITKEAIDYRLPFRLIDYQGRLYAETIVDYGWDGRDKKLVAARRVLLSFDAEMQPRPECIVAELPDQNHPQLLLGKSASLQALLSVVEEIEGGDCNMGTMNIAGYHRRDRRALVRESTTRPWLLAGKTFSRGDFSSKHVAKGAYDWLRIWRFLGPWNASKFDEMEKHGTAAQGDLADYYENTFATDRKTAEDWARQSVLAIKAAAALGAPERYRSPSPLMARIEQGTAQAEDFLELAGLLLHPYETDREPAADVLTEALGLAIAAKAGDTIYEDLIARGADINAGDQTALMRAVGDSRRVRDLLRQSADPDKSNSYGKTPLMMAAHLGGLETAKVLLDHSADVNARTNSSDGVFCSRINVASRTALMYAAENASLRVVIALLHAGADATAVDSRDRGMIDYLSRNTALTDNQRKAMRRALVKAGATK